MTASNQRSRDGSALVPRYAPRRPVETVLSSSTRLSPSTWRRSSPPPSGATAIFVASLGVSRARASPRRRKSLHRPGTGDPVSRVSPRLRWTPGDCRGLRGNRIRKKATSCRPLPTDIRMAPLLMRLNSRADMALGKLVGATSILPNPDPFVFMYVRREAVLSSQIEGTQPFPDGHSRVRGIPSSLGRRRRRRLPLAKVVVVNVDVV